MSDAQTPAEPESSRKAERDQNRNVGRDHCGSQGTHLIAGIWIIQSATRAFVVNMNQSIIVVLYVLRSVWRFFLQNREAYWQRR